MSNLNTINQWVTLTAGFLATAFAILRITLAQHKSFFERSLAFFETNLDQQRDSMESLQVAINGLAEGVRDNTRLLHDMVEWMQVSTPLGGGR